MVGGHGDDRLCGVDAVPLLGAIAMVPLLGAIVGCQFGGVDVVPLLGAIAGCHCSVLWWGVGDGQLWGSGRGAIAGCRAIVACYGGGRGGWRPTWGSGRGAIVACYGCQWQPTLGEWTWFHLTEQWHPEKLPRASCRRYVVLYIDNTKIGFCYLGSMLV